MRVIAVQTPEELEAAFAVRHEVFVREQNVSAEGERDHLDTDPRTLHCLVVADESDFFGAGGVPGILPGGAMGPPPGLALATGRLLAPNTDSVHGEGTGHGAMDPANPHIGRVAVMADARGTGAGRAVMEFLEAAALERHGVFERHGAPAADGGRHVRVELSAQDQAMPFYERLGYTVYGEGYLDEGIWHHDAFKDLH
jgi:predicted GNAT family N-acyltransferase